jgi:hypothetical protein
MEAKCSSETSVFNRLHGAISHKMEHFFKNEMVMMATDAAWIPLTAEEGISRVNNGS